jgi:transcriptional regulator with XRE-family HTH domain
MHTTLLDPLELAKVFEVSQLDLVGRLGVTSDTVRRWARDPRRLRRVRLAVLEAIVARERLAVSVEDWLSPLPPEAVNKNAPPGLDSR